MIKMVPVLYRNFIFISKLHTITLFSTIKINVLIIYKFFIFYGIDVRFHSLSLEYIERPEL